MYERKLKNKKSFIVYMIVIDNSYERIDRKLISIKIKKDPQQKMLKIFKNEIVL